jgi:predicted Fe-Mo cluster-binding NifX family protein
LKAAFATWNNRIAPVFDAVHQIHIVEAEAGRIAVERSVRFQNDTPVQKVLRLAELGVAILICGAISKPIHGILTAQGIKVVPFVAGDLHQVIQAWLKGTLTDACFAMPGHRTRSSEVGPHRDF